MLHATGVCKKFGVKPVVDKVDFSVARGECLGVIGPNGAGKTTLFNILDGTISMDAGTVRLGDADISHLAQHQRARLGLGRAYQVPRTFSALSVFENVLAGVFHGARISGAAAEIEARRILEIVGLADRRNAPAGALPLLDRKRLELAKAMSVGSKVVLLDEIAGGLTEEEVTLIVEIVRTLKQDRAVIWIEHIAHALMAVADRLLVLNFGSKLADGDPATVMGSKLVQEIYLGISVDDAA
ncbi:branched-chain amino acid transport system ATP-binding protein [Rhizobium sp. SG_E_25_P2]|uniref:ABC transporter ATP-binding protein n=1 Tax=Rhizobium sp. SG_E_25_P2 TaxID=2879942 RepID=UPI0024734386|nr:ATP-binding cassette domain-containing protein [Rhizobium sp. SG_E_25_P2]MDH6265987.1 branched-chain amino acid transport system ATP-binding protein [Rhizobium sp. SG_E_25_P2]